MKKAGIIVFWLAVWEFLSLAIHNSLILPSVGKTAGALVHILCEKDLYRVLANSLGRILAGFILAFAVGIVLAVCSYVRKTAEDLLSPFFLCIKAVPVASYVILLLFWQGSDMLSVGISFLVAVPVIYTNILEGLKKTDRKLLEMADVFGIGKWNRVWYIYRSELRMPLFSCIKLACSMGVKAGVAAEIIGIPRDSFGEKLYMSKIYLSMDELFAWTVIIVLSAFILEKGILFLAEGIFCVPVYVAENAKIPGKEENQTENTGTIHIENITKKYGDRTLLHHYSLHLAKGDVAGIMAPSGSGKTTLFRIILGLECVDDGTAEVCGAVSAVFQDTLLCEDTDVVTNMKLVSFGKKDTVRMAEELLDREDLHKKCSLFSGGMKRRAAILRALTADYDILLLDEPFVSLDDAARRKAAEFVKKQAQGKTILLFTHDKEDIKLLGGVCYESKSYVSG